MVATYVRAPPMMARGEGCYLWDVENRRYLNFVLIAKVLSALRLPFNLLPAVL